MITPCRPREHLAALTKRFPDAWQLADNFRADCGAGLPAWPDWCFLPLAGWYSIAGRGRKLAAHEIGTISELAALGAWRISQGIYRFDPTLYCAVADTPLDGDIPADVLLQMPEWGIYVDTPGAQYHGTPCHGFFAHLERDMTGGDNELRLLIDADRLYPMPIHIGPWTLTESLARAANESARHMGILTTLAGISPSALMLASRDICSLALNLILYVCSQTAEIGTGHAPLRQVPKKTKRGLRFFPPDKPTQWDVGVRLGSALRRAYHDAETGQGNPHAGPRPHIRRAHWHGFRVGPTKTPGGEQIPTEQRKLELRWLPPIAVNAELGDNLPAVIRTVKQ